MTTTWLRKLLGGAKAARAAGKSPRAHLTCEALEKRLVPVTAGGLLDVTNGVLTYTSGTLNNNLTVGMDNVNPSSAANYIFCDQAENITLTANATLAGWTYPSGNQTAGGTWVEGPKTHGSTTINAITINTGNGTDTVTLGLNGPLSIPARSPSNATTVFVGAATDAAITVRGDSTTPVQANHTISVLGEILAPTGDVELDAQNISVAASQSVLTADHAGTATGNITLNANVANGNVTVGAGALVATGNSSFTGSGGGDTGAIAVTSGAGATIAATGSLRTGNALAPNHGSGNITVLGVDSVDVEGSVRSGDGPHSGSVSLSTTAIVIPFNSNTLPFTINGTVATGNATVADTPASDTPTSGSISVSSGADIGGSGTLTTGSASLTAPVGPGAVPDGVSADNDAVTSGSISITSGSGIALSASPASLVIGTASRTATPAAGTATAGSILLTANAGAIDNGSGAPLNVTIGEASGAATNQRGLLTAAASVSALVVGPQLLIGTADINIAATSRLLVGNVTGHNVTLSAAGPLTIGVGSGPTQTVGSSGTFALTAAGNGITISTNGALSGSGSVGTGATNDALTNAGQVQPGGSGTIGTITVNGNYTQAASGTLAVEISGSTTPTYDQLAVTGTAKLGGTLNVVPIGSFAPSNRSRFNVLALNGRLAGPNNLPSDFATKTYQDGVTLQAAYNGGYNATLLTLEFLNVAASDVTSSTRVTRGGAFINTATKHITQTVTVTNTSGGTISGPIYLALSIPSSNFHLANAAGMTVMTSPTGQPYVVLSLDDLAPGASVSFTLDFTYATSPAGFSYIARVLAGGNP